VALRFRYGEREFALGDLTVQFLEKDSRRFVVRDRDREGEAWRRLVDRVGFVGNGESMPVVPGEFVALAHDLLSWGWEVEAFGKAARGSSDFRVEVKSGDDFSVTLEYKLLGP